MEPTPLDWLIVLIAFAGVIGGLLYLVDWGIGVVRKARETLASLGQRRDAAEARKRFAARQRAARDGLQPETD
jgi:uncharacterized membrane protein YagU involved in acid resistance